MGNNHKYVYKTIKEYLMTEHQERMKEPFDLGGWTDTFVSDCPQQTNGFDCGVFICQFMEKLSRKMNSPFDFTQKHIPTLRRLMVLRIGDGILPSIYD